MASVFQIESYRQLQGVQSSKTFRRAILHQQNPGSMEVAGMNGRANQQTPLSQVCSQASPGDLDLLFIDLAGPHFDGKDRLQFHNGEMRDYRERARLQ